MDTLDSPESVVIALGGARAVAAMSGAELSTVYNWCARKHFPARTYRAFSDALAARGFEAPPELWRMVDFSEGSDDAESGEVSP